MHPVLATSIATATFGLGILFCVHVRQEPLSNAEQRLCQSYKQTFKQFERDMPAAAEAFLVKAKSLGCDITAW